MRLSNLFHDNTFGVIVNGTIQRFDLHGNKLTECKLDCGVVTVLIQSPDKKTRVFGYKNGEVELYQYLRKFQVIKHNSPIVDILYNTCNNRIISLSSDGSLRITAIVDEWGDTVVLNLNKYILPELANIIIKIVE